MTDVVADTGDIGAIKQFAPMDATTNPSLILSAMELPDFAGLVSQVRKDVPKALDSQGQKRRATRALAIALHGYDFQGKLDNATPGNLTARRKVAKAAARSLDEWAAYVSATDKAFGFSTP